MALPIITRTKNAWNAFRARDETEQEQELSYVSQTVGFSSYRNPGKVNLGRGNERSMLNAVCNRIALDVAAYDIKHVRVDQNGRFISNISDSSLNEALTIEANKDQTGRDLIRDFVISMFDEGVAAIIPFETSLTPMDDGGYKIYSMRVAKIIQWFPDHIRVESYNDLVGKKERLILPKSICAIVENPLYSLMNEPNSTLKRLIRKLNLLDVIDEESGSGKLDLIIQLPYSVRTPKKTDQAHDRRSEIEEQLSGSRHGIAYIDATEKITQLNRPVENNLLTQVQYLTEMFYNQIGITEDVFSGKADERSMLNYYNRTVEVIVTAITEEMRRKFLTKTARTQGQSIMGFRDTLHLIPASELADISDSLSRNAIISANEFRAVIGMTPSTDPAANELRNKNMPTSDTLSVGEKNMPISDTSPVGKKNRRKNEKQKV